MTMSVKTDPTTSETWGPGFPIEPRPPCLISSPKQIQQQTRKKNSTFFSLSFVCRNHCNVADADDESARKWYGLSLNGVSALIERFSWQPHGPTFARSVFWVKKAGKDEVFSLDLKVDFRFSFRRHSGRSLLWLERKAGKRRLSTIIGSINQSVHP